MSDRVLRIAILGDSSSAGIGDGKDVYPYRLFKRLQRLGGVRVDNWASPGLSSADAGKVYLQRIAARSADLLVVYLGNNEGSRSRYKGTYRPLLNRLREQWGGFRHPRKPFVLGAKRPYVFSPAPASSGVATTPADFYRNLRRIINRARRVGTQVVLINPVANARFPAGLGSANFPYYRYVGLRDTIGPELVAVDASSEMLVRGIRLHAEDRLAEARDFYLQIDPDARYCYQIARNNLAVAQHEAGDDQAAVGILSEALEGELYDRAVVLYNLGCITGSDVILREAYEADVTLYRVQEAYRAMIARLGAESPIHVIDMAEIVRDEHFVDYCHLTRDGHAVLAAALVEVVARHLGGRQGPGASAYRCNFPSPDYFFRSGEDLVTYYAITADRTEAEILDAFEAVCAAESVNADEAVVVDTPPTREASLHEAIMRTVRRALHHPAVSGIADLIRFPVRHSHEIGSFPEFYVYRLLRSYGIALEGTGHQAEWQEWLGGIPVRGPEDFQQLILGSRSNGLGSAEADLSLGRRDRVLDRVEARLRRPELYVDRSTERRKTVMYWYTRESFRFGTQSRPSMLYDRVALEELAEAISVAWIIDRLRGESSARQRIDRCRRQIEALIAVHERFASRLVSAESESAKDAYSSALRELCVRRDS